MDLEGLFWYSKMNHLKDAFDIWRKKGCAQKNEFKIDGQEMIFYTGIMEFIVFLYLWRHDRVFNYLYSLFVLIVVISISICLALILTRSELR
ncbi:hypothetical protein Hanom_Chr11g01020401 [Helianthus anomalus]